MITEAGKVVAVERDGVWVETANQSACGRCSARKGCGQSLLAQMDGHRSYIKALLNGHSPGEFREGDMVTIGIDENAVVRGSLVVYCLPLLGLVAGAVIGNGFSFPDIGVAAVAFAGLVAAGLAVRWFSRRHSHDEDFQPVIIGPVSATIAVGSSSLQNIA